MTIRVQNVPASILLIATDPSALEPTLARIRQDFPGSPVNFVISAAIPPHRIPEGALKYSIPSTGMAFYRELIFWALRRRFSEYTACVFMYATFPLLISAIMFGGSRLVVTNGSKPVRSIFLAFLELAVQPFLKVVELVTLAAERFSVQAVKVWARLVSLYRGTMRRGYHRLADEFRDALKYPYYLLSGFIKGRGRHYIHQVYVVGKWLINKAIAIVVGILEGTLLRFADETAGYSRGLWARSKSSLRRLFFGLPRLAFEKWKQLVRLMAVPPAVLILLISVVGFYLQRKLAEIFDEQ